MTKDENDPFYVGSTSRGTYRVLVGAEFDLGDELELSTSVPELFEGCAGISARN